MKVKHEIEEEKKLDWCLNWKKCIHHHHHHHGRACPAVCIEQNHWLHRPSAPQQLTGEIEKRYSTTNKSNKNNNNNGHIQYYCLWVTTSDSNHITAKSSDTIGPTYAVINYWQILHRRHQPGPQTDNISIIIIVILAILACCKLIIFFSTFLKLKDFKC